MKVKITIFLAMFLAFESQLCLAHPDLNDPLDLKLKECLNQNTTTAGMVNCAKESTDAWEKEMNTVYGELLRRLDSNAQAALKESQGQWLKHKDGEFKFITAYYAKTQGSMYVPLLAGDQAHVIKERTIKLKTYLRFIDKR